MNDAAASIALLVSQIYLAEQIDALHLSIGSLLDLSEEGALDIFLEQEKKSREQKLAYLNRVIASLASPELRRLLQEEAEGGNFDLFMGKQLQEFMRLLQEELEKFTVVQLTVALPFRSADLRQMADALSDKKGTRAALDIKVDRSLIGGAIIRYGNYISDYSIKSRMGQFREHWQAAVIER